MSQPKDQPRNVFEIIEGYFRDAKPTPQVRGKRKLPPPDNPGNLAGRAARDALKKAREAKGAHILVIVQDEPTRG